MPKTVNLEKKEAQYGNDERIPARSHEKVGRGTSRTGRYANASDYVRDLIRKDQERNDKIASMQRFVDDGLNSGDGTRSRDVLFAEAVKRTESSNGSR